MLKILILSLYLCISYFCFYDLRATSFNDFEERRQRIAERQIRVKNDLPDDFPIYPDKNGRYLDTCQDNLIDLTEFFEGSPIRKAKCNVRHLELNVQTYGLYINLLARCLVDYNEEDQDIVQLVRVYGLIDYRDLDDIDDIIDNDDLQWQLLPEQSNLMKGLNKSKSLRCSQVERLGKYYTEQFNKLYIN